MVDERSGGSARFRKVPGSSGADASQGSAGGARGEGAAPPPKGKQPITTRRGASRGPRSVCAPCDVTPELFVGKNLLLPMYNGAPIALWLSFYSSALVTCLSLNVCKHACCFGFWVLASSHHLASDR